MFYIKMADLLICIHNHFDYVKDMCRDYIADAEGMRDVSDMDVEVSAEDIINEHNASKVEAGPGYCESVCVYRKINGMLLRHGGFVMHAACICADGGAYAFCAKSGVGKSTHLGLWRKVYGDRVEVINGDKPVIRRIEGNFFVYGTPWCGKEGWNVNARAPLRAICFLKRGETNHIEKMDNAVAVRHLANQIIIPRESREIADYFEIIDAMLKSVPCYGLRCNMDEDAAVVAYEGMKDG